jgi:hypothetical protein
VRFVLLGLPVIIRHSSIISAGPVAGLRFAVAVAVDTVVPPLRAGRVPR